MSDIRDMAKLSIQQKATKYGWHNAVNKEALHTFTVHRMIETNETTTVPFDREKQIDA